MQAKSSLHERACSHTCGMMTTNATLYEHPTLYLHTSELHADHSYNTTHIYILLTCLVWLLPKAWCTSKYVVWSLSSSCSNRGLVLTVMVKKGRHVLKVCVCVARRYPSYCTPNLKRVSLCACYDTSCARRFETSLSFSRRYAMHLCICSARYSCWTSIASDSILCMSCSYQCLHNDCVMSRSRWHWLSGARVA